MEVLQHMTPEGLEQYLLVDGALVSLETLSTALLSSTPTPEMELSLPRPQLQTDDLLRSSTLLLARARSASCEERK